MYKNKVREQLIQGFVAALNADKMPWHAVWQQHRPYNAVTGRMYRGINTLSLSYMADQRGYDDPRWCTFNQAKAKGWSIRSGEKAAYVEYWLWYDQKEKRWLSHRDARELVKTEPEREQDLLLRCRTSAVFNAAQIDGIPALHIQQHMTDIGEIRKQRDILLHNMELAYQEGGDRAYYSPNADTVVLPLEKDFEDTYAYMCTFLHECGHATGATQRLNRDLTGIFGSESYAREELRAEIASAFVAQALDLKLSEEQLEEHFKLHQAYVQSWADALQKDPEELFKAIRDAEKISDYLIEKGEFKDMMRHTEAKPVGRIDYLGFKGEVVEQIEYADAQEFAAEIRECGDNGVPISIVRYVDEKGQPIHVETDELNPVTTSMRTQENFAISPVEQKATISTTYEELIETLKAEKDSAAHKFGDTVPAYYKSNLQEAIQALEKCREDAAELGSTKIQLMSDELDSFDRQVDLLLRAETDPRNALHICSTTPLMRKLGMQDLPVCITRRHIMDMAAPEDQRHPERHGLTAEQIKKIPEIIKHPAIVMDSWTRPDVVLFISNELDHRGRPIMAAVRPNGTGMYQLQPTPVNFVLSMYGREDFSAFLEEAMRKNSILYIDKNKGQDLSRQAGVQFPNGFDRLSLNTIIKQSHNVVKQLQQENVPKTTIKEGGKVKKPSFNNEQYRVARECSALEYAKAQGYELIKENSYYRLKNHDSLVFAPDGHFFWNSRNINGRAIEFIQYYENRTLPEAVLILCGKDPGNYDAMAYAIAHNDTPRYWPEQEHKTESKAVFQLPKRLDPGRRMWAYLIKERGLDPEIVRQVVQNGSVYESVYKHDAGISHNVVFVGRDANGKARSASMRGCSSHSNFKREVPGSDKSFPFLLLPKRGTSTCSLRIFESAIDAMSHATLEKLAGSNNCLDCYRMATGGNNSIDGIERVLQEHPEIREIIICTDNDTGGEKIYEHLKTKLADKSDISREKVPMMKDWNEYLQMWREVICKCGEYPTSEGPQEGKLAGRIHFVDPSNGRVVATAAYADKDAEEFRADSWKLWEQKQAVIIETPTQIRELQQKRQAQEMQEVQANVEMEM